MKLAAPLLVSIAVTNECNLACQHCFPESGQQSIHELTTAEILGLVDQAADMGTFLLAYTGGEIFVKKGVLDILSHTQARGLAMTITTNGTLINSEIMRMLKRVDVRLIRVSLDHHRAEEHDRFRGKKGTFEATTRGIRWLAAEGLPVETLATVGKWNVRDVPEIARLSATLGARVFNCTLLICHGRGRALRGQEISPSEAKGLYEAIGRIRTELKGKIEIKTNHPLAHLVFEIEPDRQAVRVCPAGITILEITPEGRALPCLSFTHLGEDVREKSLRDIWNDSPLFRTVRDRMSVTGKCAGCRLIRQCGGGCRAIAYLKTGDILAPDPFCWYEPSSAYEKVHAP